MIKQARENAKSRNVPVRFKVSDFKNLNTNFNTTFDAVLCTGNSLSHVLKDKEVQKSVHEMYKMLDQEGILILHFKNYQKLLKKQRRFFVHRSSDDIFFYVWDFKPANFLNIVNYELKTGELKTCSFPFNPIKKSKITRLLKEVGFKNSKFFGNYRFNEFDLQKDDWLIIACEK